MVLNWWKSLQIFYRILQSRSILWFFWNSRDSLEILCCSQSWNRGNQINFLMDTSPLQWAQVHGRKELVSWKSCLTSVSTSTTPGVVSGWLSSTATSISVLWWISLSKSCLGAPNTASTMSFIRSSRVFFRSQLPDSSWSLFIELSWIEWISDVIRTGATDVDDGDVISCNSIHEKQNKTMDHWIQVKFFWGSLRFLLRLNSYFLGKYFTSHEVHRNPLILKSWHWTWTLDIGHWTLVLNHPNEWIR